MSSAIKGVLPALLFGALSPLAPAATFTFSGTLDSTRPTFQRPEDNGAIPPLILAVGDGRVVYYERIAFQVSVSGLYNFSMTAANFFDPTYTPSYAYYTDDGFFALYQGSFSPTAPLYHAIRAFDDVVPGVQRMPNFGQILAANQVYVLVTTTYGSYATGSYTNEISGPGEITENPEPSTVLLLGAGLAAIALRRFNCGASGSAVRRDLP